MLQQLKELTLLISLIILVVVVAYVTNPSDLALLNIHPHPFIILSVILSAYYGLRFSIISSLLCSLTYIGLVHFQIDYSIIETIWIKEYLLLPIGLSFTSIIVGEFKQITLNQKIVLAEESESNKVIISSLKKDLKAKNLELNELSLRLVNREDTIQRNLDIAKALLSTDQKVLIKNLIKVIRIDSEAKGVAFYEFNYQTQTLELKEVNGEKDGLHPLIKLDDESHDLFNIALSKEKVATLNDLDSSSPAKNEVSLVVPLKVQGSLKGVVALKGIPFLKYVPTLFSIIEMYSKWAEESLAHAQLFQELSDNKEWSVLYKTFKSGFFKELCQNVFLPYSKDLNLTKICLKEDLDQVNREKELRLEVLINVLRSNFENVMVHSYDKGAAEIHVLVPKNKSDDWAQEFKLKVSKFFDVEKLELKTISIEAYLEQDGGVA